MKLAIISDTHFGDEACTLVDHRALFKDGVAKPGDKFQAFRDAAGEHNDFLVLLGDIFDFSITSYAEAYKVAKVFFQLVQERDIAKNIIYVPGNHDVDMWHTVQQQIHVIRQVRQGKPARAFRWSLPGIIDDRTDSPTRGFLLPGGVLGPIDPEKGPDQEPDYETLFLNGISKEPDGTGRETYFYIAYPNLYMVTDRESVLLTHGHYIETFWTISGLLVRKLEQEELHDTNTLEDEVALNQPLCQLACSGIGQAGKLTSVVQEVQKEVKRQELGRIKKYCSRLRKFISSLTKSKWYNPLSWVKKGFLKLCLSRGEKCLMDGLKKRKDPRYRRPVSTEEGKERFAGYYRFSKTEIEQLNRDPELKKIDFPPIDFPPRVIYGHSHIPDKWYSDDAEDVNVDGVTVYLHNTGGWLWKTDENGKRKFCGAEVFLYDTEKGFSSKRIE
ncbi:MAG: metallophosphoesterase [Candidatus Zixiibacteriota bacterium]|nr:MAG: metallophosphoesterase [candidate division Zixibacteria bacterium]